MDYIIFKDGEEINRIVADETFCERYYAKGGYSYAPGSPPNPEPDPAPGPEPTIEQVLNVLLGEVSENG